MKHTIRNMTKKTTSATKTSTRANSLPTPSSPLALLTWCALLAPACTDGELHSRVDAGGPGDAERDAGADAELDASTDTAPSCEPLTECPVDACGSLDDGCGGALECAPCECVGGELELTEERCGPCGWGQLECAPGLTGAARCTLGEPGGRALLLEAVSPEVCQTHVVYLDPQAPEDGVGTPGEPHNALSSAQATAFNVAYAQAGVLAPIPTVIAVTSGAFTRTEALAVRDGISIVGGFTRQGDRWVYDVSGQARTTLVIERTTDQVDVVGVFADKVTSPTLVSHLDVVVGDALGGVTGFAGGSSYGLIAIDSPGLILADSSLTAGAGGAGGDGVVGADGADGRAGADGVEGTNEDTPVMPVRPPAALGGDQPACDPTLGSPRGGDGGQAGGACSSSTTPCEHYSASWTAIFPPARGERGVSVLGSLGGEPLGDGPNRYTAGAPGRASDGNDGSGAAPGLGGAGGVLGGRVDLGRWVPTGYGEPGLPGKNGGGGGGGGATEYTYTNDTAWTWGTGGAGGGSGGCAGEPGGAGAPGGASIGALLVRSETRLVDVEVVSGAGGAGGPGGAGGAGGAGARGGTGTSLAFVYANFGLGALVGFTDTYARSGDGGAGGAGAPGGHGGGGAGGASFGVYCLGSDGATFEGVDVSVNQEVAPGGAGPGNPGAPGGHADYQGCPRL